ncbi:hypothetical protein H9L19_01380 [Weissella diestrammenae]|uniref:Uncharacterized protein n=1 Tax=Weissella diestrammenae TaxID=1162633 RepID=A0A7G9T652_9LACO|nr:hypothetical protein [Weissella diestrammenae]MCM0582417.1 hypothetical protein [Weissella diestrammenae]QNN75577.1 hypothetical protein H9L19_01380 [Weissella diestrammenae]
MFKIVKNLFKRNEVAEQNTNSTFEQLKQQAGDDLKRPLTREERRLTRKGKYELDEVTRQLTPTGKTARLKYRLNWLIVFLMTSIVVVWLILFFG